MSAANDTGKAPRRPWQRAIVENVTPQVDGGRFAAKRSVGDSLTVEADAFTDGHDVMRRPSTRPASIKIHGP